MVEEVCMISNEPYYQVGGIKVSWHAIVRFLERCKGLEKKMDLLRLSGPDITDYKLIKLLEMKQGFNIQRICNELVTDSLWQEMFASGMMDGTYNHSEKYDIVLLDRHIVSFIPKEGKRNNVWYKKR